MGGPPSASTDWAKASASTASLRLTVWYSIAFGDPAVITVLVAGVMVTTMIPWTSLPGTKGSEPGRDGHARFKPFLNGSTIESASKRSDFVASHSGSLGAQIDGALVGGSACGQ